MREARAGVRGILRTEGVEDRVGKLEHTSTLASVIEQEIAAASGLVAGGSALLRARAPPSAGVGVGARQSLALRLL